MEQNQATTNNGPFQSITPGTWTAPKAFLASSDGFVFGTIQGPSSYPTGGCMCWAYIQTQGVNVFGTGGNVGYFGPSWDDCMANNNTSFMMPVSAGNYFYVGVQQDGGGCQQTDANYAFYYMPSGGSGSAEVAQGGEAPPPVAVPQSGDKMRRDWDAPERFLQVLETLLPQRIDPQVREELIGILHKM